VEISPGLNTFEFTLPFSPDTIVLDENYRFLKEKISVKKK
jgi:hypothetical protein